MTFLRIDVNNPGHPGYVFYPNRFFIRYFHFNTKHMKLILAIPALGLLCSGFLSYDKASNHAPFHSPPPTPKPVLLAVAKTIRATPDPVYKGETLDLHFTVPNAPYLGVIDPDGKFFYLVFPAADAVGKLQPLVDSETFAKLSILRISTATLKADPYTYGVYENQAVFTKSGTYRFICGENLHVDDEDEIQVVQIRYKHVARPAIAFSN